MREEGKRERRDRRRRLEEFRRQRCTLFPGSYCFHLVAAEVMMTESRRRERARRVTTGRALEILESGAEGGAVGGR